MSDFIQNYPKERAKVFITLDGCKTDKQLQAARNYFDAFIRKWKPKARKINHKVMIEVDEDTFNIRASLKERILIFPID